MENKMSKFIKANFDFHGGYLTYHADGTNTTSSGRFVARFKYNKKRKGKFLTFLCKNFEVEEYFNLIEKEKMSPIGALETKNYDPLTLKQRKQLEEDIKQYETEKVGI